MQYDVERVREMFPSLAIVDGGKLRIYFDNPGGTQVPKTVVDRISECLYERNANLGGYFATSVKADAVMDEMRCAVADLLNAPAAEDIVYGQNMTTITLHISRSLGKLLSPGEEIILTRMDHDANVAPWLHLARDIGLEVKWLPFNLETFEFDLNELSQMITSKTRLLCIGGASNLTGTIHPIKSICAIAKAAGVWTYIDAVQSVPHVSTDVQDLDCDFLVCSPYKFFGPHQGVLYGRRELMEKLEPYKVRPAPNEMPEAFETGTQNHECAAGVTAAVEYFAWIGNSMAGSYHERYKHFNERRQAVHAAMDCLFNYETELTSHLITGLQRYSGLKILGITDPQAFGRRVPTVSFIVEGDSPDRIAKALAEENIFVWQGHNFAVEAVTALGIIDKGSAVRVGLVHYNTLDEVDQLLASLDRILS
ncbi:cysteine desulfurase-like protein [Bythopirellula goksoeyrii]|uniref:Putative cysteine desulfurase n=1 Tax=Bythopirellula goksoeyrii TaxID=1400387 RepID=A0A5B9QCM5_9BACT|nr:cysteine desulfurase-like protein [Bythopirellula goksoeyrii]QEG36817.1 putative cysteine desulfurase [Bythopirellula goksoeyrii]